MNDQECGSHSFISPLRDCVFVDFCDAGLRVCVDAIEFFAWTKFRVFVLLFSCLRAADILYTDFTVCTL